MLALSLRRLSDDRLAVHGYPVWLAETFVDPAHFTGTCTRASNGLPLGTTHGFAHRPGVSATWLYQGQPKAVLVCSLTDNVTDKLCGAGVPDNRQVKPQQTETATARELRTGHDHLAGLSDFRKPRGQRDSLACLFTLIIAARLSGVRGVSAFTQTAALLSPEQLQAAGAFWSPSKQRVTTPAISTCHGFWSHLSAEALDEAVYDGLQSHSEGQAALAVDGNTLRRRRTVVWNSATAPCLTSAALSGTACPLPGHRQACCITHHRAVLRTDKTTEVAAFGLTSLTRQ